MPFSYLFISFLGNELLKRHIFGNKQRRWLDNSGGAPDLRAAPQPRLISIPRSEPTVRVFIKSNVLLIFKPSKNIDLSICLA